MKAVLVLLFSCALFPHKLYLLYPEDDMKEYSYTSELSANRIKAIIMNAAKPANFGCLCK